MTDIEITKLCAEAMGLEVSMYGGQLCYYQETVFPDGDHIAYQPLTNDAQAMALVKKFKIECNAPEWSDSKWVASYGNQGVWNADLNRAICECVAKMQAAK